MTSEMNSSMQSRKMPHNGSPESEFNFECFQNYTAPEIFVQHIAGFVNQDDIELMIRAQKQMLQRFEKTNEMLLNCNALSVNRLKIAGEDFRKHTKMLNEMKKDLDYIFKKVRIIKTKLSGQYPQAFEDVTSQNRNSIAEEADEDTTVPITAVNEPSTSTSVKQQIQTPKHKSSENVKPTIDYVDMDHQSSPDTDKNNIAIKINSNQSSSTDNSTSSESDTG